MRRTRTRTTMESGSDDEEDENEDGNESSYEEDDQLDTSNSPLHDDTVWMDGKELDYPCPNKETLTALVLQLSIFFATEQFTDGCPASSLLVYFSGDSRLFSRWYNVSTSAGLYLMSSVFNPSASPPSSRMDSTLSTLPVSRKAISTSRQASPTSSSISTSIYLYRLSSASPRVYLSSQLWSRNRLSRRSYISSSVER